METGAILLVATIMIPVIVAFACLPYFSRRTSNFGISIAEAHYDDRKLRAMRRSYALLNGAFGAVVCAVTLLAMPRTEEPSFAVWIIAANVLIIAVATASFLFNYYRMKRLKTERHWESAATGFVAVDTTFHRRVTTYSNWLFLAHAAVIVACFVFAASHYEALPDRLVSHYDLQGNPTATVPKTYWNVFFPNVIQIILLLLFMLINTVIRTSKQQIDFHAPERSREQNIRFRRIWSLFLMGMGLLIMLLFGLIQYSFVYEMNSTVMIATAIGIPAIIVIGAIALSFVTGQGGSRLRDKAGAPAGAGQRIADDDKYWKFGSMYYNPDDPALFVEKRVGIGWTINMARPLAWVLLFAPLALIAIVAVFSALNR